MDEQCLERCVLLRAPYPVHLFEPDSTPGQLGPHVADVVDPGEEVVMVHAAIVIRPPRSIARRGGSGTYRARRVVDGVIIWAMNRRWLGRDIYIDVSLLVALSEVAALGLGVFAWVRLWALFGDYPSPADRAVSLACACIAAALAIAPPVLAWRHEPRARWAVVSGAGVVLSALVFIAVATSEVQ